MVYVDTSVLVALCALERMTAAVSNWYFSGRDSLISGAWCATEFASALGVKRRTRQITDEESSAAWDAFERLCAKDLRLTPIKPSVFRHAAVLALDASTGLRAGDALHLATALDCNARSIATLDILLADNAKRKRLRLVQL
ncbi:type II toxin-antitoxin system VapC family toxin [Caballeronia sp. LZ035]|uniref:type II toxin-antitoxin system VapC family toxin n=1 Tax=Caballeronia sp. LZ035 TaxID=3038568 RepID=UPI0028548A40|nr:type II toxin-antitoxin system VapC family toxin [Caballeronia sp. LZ035]MDR5756227.1 type II toxin-antitoxin system VapC family toxin [Caballeronia sp. LZ035]